MAVLLGLSIWTVRQLRAAKVRPLRRPASFDTPLRRPVEFELAAPEPQVLPEAL